MSDILSQIVDLDNQIENLVEKWYSSFLEPDFDVADERLYKLESKWYSALQNDGIDEIKVPFFLKNCTSIYREQYKSLVKQRNNFEDLYLS